MNKHSLLFGFILIWLFCEQSAAGLPLSSFSKPTSPTLKTYYTNSYGCPTNSPAGTKLYTGAQNICTTSLTCPSGYSLSNGACVAPSVKPSCPTNFSAVNGVCQASAVAIPVKNTGYVCSSGALATPNNASGLCCPQNWSGVYVSTIPSYWMPPQGLGSVTVQGQTCMQ